jgi:hypothetical protein
MAAKLALLKMTGVAMVLDKKSPELDILGWREWVSLPDLGIDAIKAKVDTGAKTSALHAHYITPFEQQGELWVRFGLHPNQKDTRTSIDCVARVKDRRPVTDSGGHTEKRFVIETSLKINNLLFPIEMTLTDRENMRFRMLLGRNGLKGVFLVDSQKSFLLGGSRTQPPLAGL